MDVPKQTLWIALFALLAAPTCLPSGGGGGGSNGEAADATDGSNDDASAGEASTSTCVDGDGDGYGSNSDRSDRSTCPACESGESGGCSRDCDDSNPEIFPSATEDCNGVDDNCNDIADEAIGNSSCIEGECRLSSSETPQDGTVWGCAVVGGTMQCVLKGEFADDKSSCMEESAYGVCDSGSWTSVPDECTSP